jgi:Ca2+-transporting ATPase
LSALRTHGCLCAYLNVIGNLHTPQVIPIHTAVPGRIRCKVAALYRADGAVKIQLESRLRALEEIESVSASTLTGSVLVLYDASKTPVDIVSLICGEVAVLDKLGAINPALSETAGSDCDFNEYRPIGTDVPISVSANIQMGEAPPHLQWHSLERDTVLDKLHTRISVGLTSEEAAARLARFSPNALPQPRPRSALGALLEQFKSLPVMLLGAAAGVSAITGGLFDATAILAVIVLNAAIGFVTERQSEMTIRALTRVQLDPALVLRDQRRHEISVEDIVIGDVLILTPGQHVAADARLVKTKRLLADESQLTGESVPVSKSAKGALDAEVVLADRSNMAYRGTRVTGGSGIAVVVATGPHTEIGKVQTLATAAEAPQTPMQLQLAGMGSQLVMLSGLVCAAEFLIGLMRGYSAIQMFKSAVSLAVAALPEGLPTVATATLALGIRDLRTHHVLIRKLDAVEALGAMQVMCLDKTGTLTTNRMSVTRAYMGAKRIDIEQNGFMVSGAAINPIQRADLMRLMQLLALCNEATLEYGENGPRVNGSGTEAALLELALRAGIDPAQVRAAHPLQKTRYRSTGRLYMRTIHELAAGQRLVAVKGNPGQVLSMCRWHLAEGAISELSDGDRARIELENERMAADALRVLGVAYAEGQVKPHKLGLIWVGLVGMTDQLRPGIRPLLEAVRMAGIEPVMITGDQSATARAVACEIGLNGSAPLELIDANQLEELDSSLRADAEQKVHVFSRVDPSQKLKIVRGFQRAGLVVAMSGDGVNDAPALKAADIGIAIGGSGEEAARSVADVVLEGDRLDAMLAAVREGRTIHRNIRKSIHFLLSTNLSEIEVTLASLLLGLGTPLSPMQLLWINLITDIFPGLALALEPSEADVLKSPPRDPREPILRRRDFRRLTKESTLISAGALGSYAYSLVRHGAGARAGTQAFLTLVLGQLLHAYSCRSERTTVFNPGGRAPNRYLNTAVGGSAALQVLAVLAPGLRHVLGTVPISIIDGLVAGATAALPLLINEATKSEERDSAL